ncbi:DUF2637 domain-containing protein [Streptomyces spectabilis]|uniref:DUF2637 domain-containing protein n=1 Tax=Streptomyces spectabilis TaxID=68270 RepID=UPI0033EAFB04
MTRSIRADAVLIQAVIAGALSFAHLYDLAAAAGQSGWKAWAYPISVDLLLVAAWRRLRTGGTAWLAWSWFVIALVASLGANIATAGLLNLDHVPAWLRILVAGWPAAAFLGGTLLAHQPTPCPAPAPVTEPATAAPTMVAEPEPEPAPPSREITPPAPAPAPPVPAAAVPPALIEHARKVNADHRARTGADIDPATLRARLGVPAPLADAIAAQLT